MAKLMRAFTLDGFDAVPRLRDDVVVREPDRDQLLIRVHASSVNPSDVYAAMGMLKQWGMEYRFPVTLGHDLAGVVERVGSEVTAYAVGDEVFGFISTEPILHDGTYADYAVVPEDRFISAKPRSLDFTHAAVVPLAASTAWFAVGALDVSDGERLLIIGGSGGVGSFAVQLAAARGAHVIATALDEDEEYLRVGRARSFLATLTSSQPSTSATLTASRRCSTSRIVSPRVSQRLLVSCSPVRAPLRCSRPRLKTQKHGSMASTLSTVLIPRCSPTSPSESTPTPCRHPCNGPMRSPRFSLAFEDLQTQHTQGKLAITMV